MSGRVHSERYKLVNGTYGNFFGTEGSIATTSLFKVCTNGKRRVYLVLNPPIQYVLAVDLHTIFDLQRLPSAFL